jgi:hypothetical protein
MQCDEGSFGALGSSGTLYVTSIGFGNGTMTYTGVTVPSGDGPGAYSSITVSGSTGIAYNATDGSTRYIINYDDGYGAKIFRPGNQLGAELNDNFTFRSTGVGYTSASDIVIGYTNYSARTGGAVIFGTDFEGGFPGFFGTPYVMLSRYDASGVHGLRVTTDGVVFTMNSSGFAPGSAIGLGSSSFRWGTSYIGSVLGGTGSASSPIFGFANDTTGGVGFFSTGTGTGAVGFTSAGTQVLTISGSLIYPTTTNTYSLGSSTNRFQYTYGGTYYANIGSGSAPSYTFASDTGTGFSSGGTGVLFVNAGGVTVATFNSTGLVIPSQAASTTNVSHQPSMRPTNWTAESYPRGFTTSNSVPSAGATGATGTLRMTAVYLATGTVVNNLNVLIGGTGATAPTHFWMGLYDYNRNQLAVTADQTTAAISANTLYSLAIATTAAGSASSFTTTYSGMHYVGVMVIATTTLPTFCGPTSSVSGEYAIIIPPILSGTSDTATGGPPAFSHTAAALSGSEMIYVGTS